MKELIKKGCLGFIILGVITGCFNGEEKNNNDNEIYSRDKVIIYYFWDKGCPFCIQLKPHLEGFDEKYPEVVLKGIEAWQSQKTRHLFQEVARAYNIEVEGVPVTFIGDKSWKGFNESLIPQMETQIKKCIAEGCEDKAYDIIFKE